MVAPFVMRSIPGKIIDKHPDLQSFDQYGAAFKARLTGPTLGGAEPGPADAQLWGIVAIAKVFRPLVKRLTNGQTIDAIDP
jgi:hypothetical protein